MELEEMKSLWEDMSQKVDQQKILTDQLILDMTKERFDTKMRSISIPESITALICFAAVIYIISNFNSLDIWYLQLTGIFAIIACLVLPVLSLKSIQKMKSVHISKSTFKETVAAYAKGKAKFMQIQKTSFYASFLVLIALVIVFGKIMKGIDVFTMTEKLNWLVPSGIGVLFIFSQWVLKKYKKATDSANNILKELEE
ncbi:MULTISPECIES: hypothetical protein [Flavobacteriaceae]|uniref:DUF3278 domain-containing protein n=2 Tax=Flavobacteriaceae TaxID=49546 RepID=A0A4Y8ANK6_9FLAO|nr:MULTISPECIES: hypothetical protein [Flavobacteriaceae]TEW72073.1 hypothetical protein E2488_14480 [Gramella jeungdoensis]GGK56209.1 hypothetical protein GCM10007963_25470 [Lutibacter litoralis]